MKTFPSWRLYLHENQTYLYRCYLWLSGEHTDLQQRPQLTSTQREHLDAAVWTVHQALAQLSMPDMVNALYAGNEYHLHRGHAHLHLIPRYYNPPTFAGIRFPDVRFGKLHGPYGECDLPEDVMEAIRVSLAYALEEVLKSA